MSYDSINRCTRDAAFQQRVEAAAMKEAYHGDAVFSESSFGAQLRNSTIPASPVANLTMSLAINTFIWPLSVDNEDAYAYAVETGNENPGGDPGVITDAAIQAGIQHWWPK